MVQRVELVPASVRGYGNVVSPKVVGDFEVFNCSLSQVDNVYTMVYGAGEVSVALSVSPATVTYGQSVVLEATVLEDNNPLEGVTVQFFDGNSVLGTGTSDVNGVASLTVSDLSVGSHSINAQYDSESSNSVTVTVNVPYTDITLTSDKDTLSYADGDSATLTVQLVDGQGDAVSYAGESVTFEVHKVSDDSLVETLTSGTTNSSGIATTTMSSRGTGDVYIKSLCGLVTETYRIEDCIKYNHTDTTGWSTNNNPTITTSDTGITITTSSSGEKALYYPQLFTSDDDVELVCTWLDGNKNVQALGIAYLRESDKDSTKSAGYATYFRYNFGSGGKNVNHSLNANDVIRLQYVNGTCKLYCNDDLIGSEQTSIYNFYLGFFTNNGRSQTIKDIKIKPL